MRRTGGAAGEGCPGSYGGHREAAPGGGGVFAGLDPPVPSGRQEASHYICMTPERRAGLDRDAGGTDLEESAVCYLQVLLADQVPGLGRARLFSDMDAWGYSFRLGSTRAWFEGDASDARDWLQQHGLIDAGGGVTGAVRTR